MSQLTNIVDCANKSIDYIKSIKLQDDLENIAVIDYVRQELKYWKLHLEFPEIIQFVEKCISIYQNANRQTRFVHYMGPIDQMNKMIEMGWYEVIDKELVPQCKCLNNNKEHNHDHCIVKTIMTTRQIQSKRLNDKRKAEPMLKVQGDRIRTLPINNLYHFISTVLYILCSVSTTNNTEHMHYDNLPFKIDFKTKQDLNKMFAVQYNCEEERISFLDNHRFKKPKNKRIKLNK